MTPKILEERVQQAWGLGLDQQMAVALCSHLLRELESYPARRKRRGYHTDFDDFLDAHLPGLALAIKLLSGDEASLGRMEMQERWGDLHPDMVELLQSLAATFGLNYADRVVDALQKEV